MHLQMLSLLPTITFLHPLLMHLISCNTVPYGYTACWPMPNTIYAFCPALPNVIYIYNYGLSIILYMSCPTHYRAHAPPPPTPLLRYILDRVPMQLHSCDHIAFPLTLLHFCTLITLPFSFYIAMPSCYTSAIPFPDYYESMSSL